MGTKSQLFRVFVEGETISDGRKITADMIDECVATFDLKTYTPRINIEHIAGYSPEPPFNGYGDVIALEARDDEFTIAGTVEKRRALYAQVDANDQLVKLGKADQKPFPSVELTPSYAGSGKVGLVGLAFTDTPASIGTERLKFSSRAPGTVFAHGSEAVAIPFETPATDTAAVVSSFTAAMAKVADMFKPKASEPEPKKEQPGAPANDNDARFASAIEALGTSMVAAFKPLADAQAATAAQLTTLEQRLSKEEAPGGFSRAPATGGAIDSKYLTDC